MPKGGAEDPFASDRILVVFDVNVFLDVAEILGEPFSWQGFADEVAKANVLPVPYILDARYDSLRAVATAFNGVYPSGRRIEVWTSDHIDRMTASKAAQSTSATDPRDRGLGWSVDSAQKLVDSLIADVVYEWTDGDSLGEIEVSYGSPPLDHEDGCVYATVDRAGREGIYYERFVVTRDKGFLAAPLPGLISVMHPAVWVAQVRTESRNLALRPGSGKGTSTVG